MKIIGIDEVGRGCWAGPLVAGAVLLPPNFNLEDGPLGMGLQLRDSKKLSKIQREKLAKIIHEEAVAVGLGWVWPQEIDSGGITAAVKRAMQQALLAITTEYDELIVDGNINYFIDNPKARAVVKADDLFSSVSAASIVAKVARDNYMSEIARRHPGYGFERHVGYGTAEHITALHNLGVCEIHRRSFKPIQKMV